MQNASEVNSIFSQGCGIAYSYKGNIMIQNN